MNKIGNKYSISSLTNEKIKIINSLSQRKYRKQLNLFVAEGIRLCKEALDKNWEIKYFLYDKDKADDELVMKLIDHVISRGGDALEVTFNILSKISHKENAQNVLGVIKQKWTNLPKQLNKESWVALECVRDPGNLGTIFRTMDAVGAKGCFLIDECTDPFSYEAVRASMGAIFNLNIISINSKQFIEWRKKTFFTLIGTSLKNAADYRKADWDLPLILLMGNEQKGLSDQLITECDQLIKIPMLGSSDSLNLAVSTGVALYESIRKNPI